MSAKDIIKKAEKAFSDAFNSANVGGGDIMQFYTSDCRYMANGSPIAIGHEQTKATFDKYMKGAGAGHKSRMVIDCQEAFEAGNYIVASGDYKLVDDSKSHEEGKYVSVYKQEGGKWKIFYDINNTN